MGIRALKKGNVRQFENAVSNSMESFLNILTDDMANEDGGRRDGNPLGIPSGMLPNTDSESKILRWIIAKKNNQNKSHRDHPKYMEKDVAAGLIWLVRTMARECRRNSFSDEE